MREKMKLEFDSISSNESFARVTVASFLVRLDPTMDELTDVKTAVSEAVTNCVVHGYENKEGTIRLECYIEDDEVTITVEDAGVGIEDIEKAREPLYTTKPDEDRAGMGFSFMEIFMDELIIESKVNVGTKVTMKKKINKK